mgnify:CR=1 FL=1
MTTKITSTEYIDFVKQTTSPASSDFSQLVSRMEELSTSGADVSRLLTAALGMSAEAGEFTEVVKKIILQSKPYSEENIFHMKRELGDLVWYMAQACLALNISFDEILQMNFEKLSTRYPEGTFTVHRSENRRPGDV